MGYLQLAEGYENLAENVLMNRDKYIFIPMGYRGAQKDLYVREDFFDNMPEADYQQMMLELSRFQNTGLSSNASERRAARKAKKAQKKTTKAATKDEKKAKRAERFGGILDKVGGIVGNIVGGGKQVEVDAAPGQFQVKVDDQEESWLSRNKVPVAIGAVVLIGGGIYLATRKKKR